MLDKFYKLRNTKTNATMFYDELSDYLFYKGWRIEREAKISEVNYLTFCAVEHELQKEIYD
jgi:hypothetical protein